MTVAEQCRAWLVDELRFVPCPYREGWLTSPDGWALVVDPAVEVAIPPHRLPWANLADFQWTVQQVLALKPPTWGQPELLPYSFCGAEVR